MILISYFSSLAFEADCVSERKIFCVATFLTSVSFFGTLISELNEIVNSKARMASCYVINHNSLAACCYV